MLINGRSPKTHTPQAELEPSSRAETAAPEASLGRLEPIAPAADNIAAKTTAKTAAKTTAKATPPPPPSHLRQPKPAAQSKSFQTTIVTGDENASKHPLKSAKLVKPAENQPPKNTAKPAAKKRFQIPIATKATLLALFMGLVPLAGLGALTYVSTSQTIAQRMADQNQTNARITLDRLNEFLASRITEVQSLASLPTLNDPKVRKVTTPDDQQQILDRSRAIHRDFESVAVFDLGGRLQLQSGESPTEDPKNQDYFQTALKTKRPTIGQPERLDGTDLYQLHFAAPIQDRTTGKVLGILVARINLQQLDGLLKPTGTLNEKPSDAYLFDPSGTVLRSSNPTKLPASKANTPASLAAAFPGFEALNTSPQSAGTWISPSLKNGVALLLPEARQSQEALLGLAKARPLATLPLVNWGVAFASDSGGVLSEQRQQLQWIGLSTLAVVALITALASLTAKRAAEIVQTQLQDTEDEVAKLNRSRQLSTDRSSLLAEIVDRMRQSILEEDILNTTVNELRYALTTDRIIVYRFHDDWNGTIIAESVGAGWNKTLGDTVQDPFREGLIDRYKNGRVRSMDDVYASNLTQCHLDILEGFQIRASIVAPILQNGTLMGLLCAHQCDGPRHWEPEDVDFFSKLSSQLGYVLDQGQLLQKQTRTADRSRLLNQIVENMRQSLVEDVILNTTVSEVRYALNTDRVIVYRFHDDWNGTIIAESVGLGWNKTLGDRVMDPFREGLIDRYKNGRVRAMNDAQAEALADCYRTLLDGFQIRASIVAPILQNGELIGLLCAHQCSGPRVWDDTDVDLFAKLSTQLGFALDQASLLRKQTRSADRSRLLNEIVANMRRSLKEEDILNTTISELRYALNTDRVIVYRFHDDWNGTIIAESVALGWEKILGETVQDPFREGLIERYKNGRVRAMNDVNAEGLADCHRAILAGFQIRASIVAPILEQGQLIGLLCAHQCNGPRVWEDEDVDLFTKLAIQLGFALDQASVFGKQLRSAEQSRLLSEVVGNMRRSMTRDGVLNTTVSELRYALSTDRVIIYRFDDEWNGTIIAESVAAGWRKVISRNKPT